MSSPYALPIARLIDELCKLPGVGPKTGQRLAFHLLHRRPEDARSLAQAILDATEQIGTCSVCQNLTDTDPCAICRDSARDGSVICVVEEPRDLAAMERTGEYRGRYHVLQGAISPMDGVGPEELRIRELLSRVQGGGVREVILATNTDVEGETTAMYLARVLKPFQVSVTRIARGLPVGGDLDYADQVTLARALEGRREV
ncbi:MAG: recombination mediator RecR [Thermaerobacter sp.]|jgi:recombination protein RecR|nr:recombination mediator RecR [Thermaerobacter sp.]